MIPLYLYGMLPKIRMRIRLIHDTQAIEINKNNTNPLIGLYRYHLNYKVWEVSI